MKKIIIIILAVATIIAIIQANKDKTAEPFKEIEVVVIKNDLPKVSFNFTPINERTEQPAPLPDPKFNYTPINQR